MPIYEYTCGGCNQRFEELRKIGAETSGVRCPHCGSDEVKKQFSTFAGASTPSGGTLPCGASSSSGCGGGGFT